MAWCAQWLQRTRGTLPCTRGGGTAVLWAGVCPPSRGVPYARVLGATPGQMPRMEWSNHTRWRLERFVIMPQATTRRPHPGKLQDSTGCAASHSPGLPVSLSIRWTSVRARLPAAPAFRGPRSLSMKSAARSILEISGIVAPPACNEAARERRFRFDSFVAPTKWTGS